jgi:hypothetical protein
MALDVPHGLSKRAWSNVAGIMPQISAAVKAREQTDDSTIDLATAENWLLRPELIELCKTAINTRLEAKVSKGLG